MSRFIRSQEQSLEAILNSHLLSALLSLLLTTQSQFTIINTSPVDCLLGKFQIPLHILTLGEKAFTSAPY